MALTPRTLGEIARAVDGALEGDPDHTVRGVAGLDEAGPEDLTFLARPAYARALARTRAACAVVGKDVREAPCALIRTADPDLAFARAVAFMAPPLARPDPGVHPTAVVAADARLGADVAVGPHAVVEPGAEVGERTALWAGVYVGRDARVGADCDLRPHATVCHECVLGARVTLHPGAVVGSDGFGYAWDGARHVKIPQVGRVVVEDEVEIGANTTIDRARFGETRIGAGTKLDNLVQIAHNVQVGPLCAFAAQVGVSGSTRIGAGTLMGGQSGAAGHLSIGPQSRIAGRAGVTKSLPGKDQYTGYPARPHDQQVDEWRHVKALGRLRRTVRDLEQRIRNLEA